MVHDVDVIAVQNISFNDLSPKIRNKIYELALTDPAGVSVQAKTEGYRRTAYRSDKERLRLKLECQSLPKSSGSALKTDTEPIPKLTSLVPALLRAHKQTCSEGINHLYGQAIGFDNMMAMHQFLVDIGVSNHKRLLDVPVKSQGWPEHLNYPAYALLAGATDLTRLSVKYGVGNHCDSPTAIGRRLCRDMYAFLEGYGYANGRRDAAADIIKITEGEILKCCKQWTGRPVALQWSTEGKLTPEGADRWLRETMRTATGVK